MNSDMWEEEDEDHHLHVFLWAWAKWPSIFFKLFFIGFGHLAHFLLKEKQRNWAISFGSFLWANSSFFLKGPVAIIYLWHRDDYEI